jgi:hypothetical protein
MITLSLTVNRTRLFMTVHAIQGYGREMVHCGRGCPVGVGCWLVEDVDEVGSVDAIVSAPQLHPAIINAIKQALAN